MAEVSVAKAAAAPHTEAAPSFEDFVYWAKLTRQEECAAEKARKKATPSRLARRLTKTTSSQQDETPSQQDGSRLRQDESSSPAVIVTDEEWKTASRAMRTTGWSAVFYLITTDVIGPDSVPWSYAQLGYGPAIAIYTVFGALSAYSAWIMWQIFLGLDSDRYPLLTYGHLFVRIFGPTTQHLVNAMLAVQLILLVSVVILGAGQAISQISQRGGASPGICFVVCLVIFTAVGSVVGQVRTLQHFSRLSIFSLWTYSIALIICMGVVAHSPPNFKATQASYGSNFGPGPIRTFAGPPPPGMASSGFGISATLDGLNQAVYAWGGCMTFVTFLAEMRHPLDFWKGFLVAQLFMYFVYMVFGIYVYSFQGQFAFNPVVQGMSPYLWQTVANSMGLVPSLICAALYGNIGLKLIYAEFLQPVLGLPPWTHGWGKAAWAVSMPVYWTLAFVIAAAVPQFSYVSGLMSAFFMLSFTYTLPALLALGYWLQLDALAVSTGRMAAVVREEDGWARWRRAWAKRPLFHAFNLFYMVGGLVTTGMGVYSSIEGLQAAFAGKSEATSFGCTPPV